MTDSDNLSGFTKSLYAAIETRAARSPAASPRWLRWNGIHAIGTRRAARRVYQSPRSA